MRILIAGTGSGCGKTTASLILMAALRQKGMDVLPCKVGPDYIDPGFHRVVCGRPSYNLDSWLIDPQDIPEILDKPADIAVIEGVMGYYDGLDAISGRCSTWEIAALTKTPVILTIDASGSAASAAAVVKGFQELHGNNGIAGVLVNQASSEHHYELIRDAVSHYTGLPCVGWIPKTAALDLKSRHLGLVPAEETQNTKERVFSAAQQCMSTLDMPLILNLASAAPKLDYIKRVYESFAPFRLGIAMDSAFTFYYQDNLDILQQMGIELRPFSPINDAKLPDDLDGLYFGGGFPEIFANRLSANTSMRRSVREVLSRGLPCYAECGGMMYLSERLDGHEMVGFLPQTCRMTGRLQHFGYVTVRDENGLTFPAHEFHYGLAEGATEDLHRFLIQKASRPDTTWLGGLTVGRTVAGFAHLHFRSHPELVRRLWR